MSANWTFKKTQSSYLLSITLVLSVGCAPEEAPVEEKPQSSPQPYTQAYNQSPTPYPTPFGTPFPTTGDADVGIYLNGAATAVTSIQVAPNQPLNWIFTARSVSNPATQYVVYRADVNPKPNTMNIVGSNSANVSITWSPAATDPAVGSVQLTIRNMTLCSQASTTTVNPGVAGCSNYATAMAGEISRAVQWSLPNGQVGLTGNQNNPGKTLLNLGLLGAGLGFLSGAGPLQGAMNMMSMGGGLMNQGMMNQGYMNPGMMNQGYMNQGYMNQGYTNPNQSTYYNPNQNGYNSNQNGYYNSNQNGGYYNQNNTGYNRYGNGY
jgi:hypothetical protein